MENEIKQGSMFFLKNKTLNHKYIHGCETLFLLCQIAVYMFTSIYICMYIQYFMNILIHLTQSIVVTLFWSIE